MFMMNTSSIVKMILNKKKMTNMDLVRKMNEIEEKTGVKERTTKQRMTNYLNDYYKFGYSLARRVEIALDLPKETLMRTCPKPNTPAERREYKEELNKWEEI